MLEIITHLGDDMRGKRLVTIIIVCILLCIQIIVIGNTMGATYHKGDFWEYDYEEYYEDMDMDGTMRMEVTGWDKVSVQGVTYDTTVVTFSSDGTIYGSDSGVVITGTYTATGKYYYQESNDELIKSITNLDMDGTATYMGYTNDFSSTAYNESSYYLLEDNQATNIKVGDLGNSKASVTYHSTMHHEMAGSTDDSSEDGTFQEDKDYNCLKKEKVTVPAGTFDTYLIRTTKSDGSYFLDWYSKKAGQSVRGEAYDSEGDKIVSMELISYKFKGSETASEELFGMSYDSFSLLLLIIIIIILLILVVLLFARRKKKSPASQSQPIRGETSQSLSPQISQPPPPRQDPPPYPIPPPPPDQPR
jgi:hypothetical protein